MAKEDEDIDDLGLDDDDDFNMDDLGLDDSDMEGLDPDVGDDRTPSVGVIQDTSRSFVESFTDDKVGTLATVAKSAIPSSVSEDTDVVFEAYNSVADEVRSQGSKLRREAKRTVKAVRRLVPGGDDNFLARGLDGLANILDDDDEGASGNSGPTQAELINSELIQMLGEKQTAEANEAAFKEQLEATRNQEDKQLLATTALNTERLRKFNFEITDKYYRTSIEVGLRQLYTQQELLKVTKEGFDIFKGTLASISKNTALPEVVKIRETELAGQLIKQKAIESVGSAMFKSGTPFQQISTKINAGIKDVSGRILEGLEAAAGTVDMAESMTGDGMSPTEMLGQFGAEYAKDKAGKLIAKLVAKTDEGASGIVKSRIMAGDWRHTLETLAKQDGMAGMAAEKLVALLPSEKANFKIERDDPNAAAYLDNRTKDSINKIIPQLLSKIHVETQAIKEIAALGLSRKDRAKFNNLSDKELLYDNKTGEMTTRGELGNKLRETTARDAKAKVGDRATAVLREILRTSKQKYTDEEKKAIHGAIVTAVLRGAPTSVELLTAPVFANSLKLTNDELPKKLSKEYDTIESAANKAQKSGDDDALAQIDRISSVLKEMKSASSQHEAIARDLVDRGLTDEAINLGFLRRDKETGELSGHRDYSLYDIEQGAKQADIGRPLTKEEQEFEDDLADKEDNKVDDDAGILAKAKAKVTGGTKAFAKGFARAAVEDDPEDSKYDQILVPNRGFHDGGDSSKLTDEDKARGFDLDGVTKDDILGFVHGKEFVLNAEMYEKLMHAIANGNADGVLKVVKDIANMADTNTDEFKSIANKLDSGLDAIADKLTAVGDKTVNMSLTDAATGSSMDISEILYQTAMFAKDAANSAAKASDSNAESAGLVSVAVKTLSGLGAGITNTFNSLMSKAPLDLDTAKDAATNASENYKHVLTAGRASFMAAISGEDAVELDEDKIREEALKNFKYKDMHVSALSSVDTSEMSEDDKKEHERKLEEARVKAKEREELARNKHVELAISAHKAGAVAGDKASDVRESIASASNELLATVTGNKKTKPAELLDNTLRYLDSGGVFPPLSKEGAIRLGKIYDRAPNTIKEQMYNAINDRMPFPKGVSFVDHITNVASDDGMSYKDKAKRLHKELLKHTSDPTKLFTEFKEYAGSLKTSAIDSLNKSEAGKALVTTANDAIDYTKDKTKEIDESLGISKKAKSLKKDVERTEAYTQTKALIDAGVDKTTATGKELYRRAKVADDRGPMALINSGFKFMETGEIGDILLPGEVKRVADYLKEQSAKPAKDGRPNIANKIIEKIRNGIMDKDGNPVKLPKDADIELLVSEAFSYGGGSPDGIINKAGKLVKGVFNLNNSVDVDNVSTKKRKPLSKRTDKKSKTPEELLELGIRYAEYGVKSARLTTNDVKRVITYLKDKDNTAVLVRTMKKLDSISPLPPGESLENALTRAFVMKGYSDGIISKAATTTKNLLVGDSAKDLDEVDYEIDSIANASRYKTDQAKELAKEKADNAHKLSAVGGEDASLKETLAAGLKFMKTHSMYDMPTLRNVNKLISGLKRTTPEYQKQILEQIVALDPKMKGKPLEKVIRKSFISTVKKGGTVDNISNKISKYANEDNVMEKRLYGTGKAEARRREVLGDIDPDKDDYVAVWDELNDDEQKALRDEFFSSVEYAERYVTSFKYWLRDFKHINPGSLGSRIGVLASAFGAVKDRVISPLAKAKQEVTDEVIARLNGTALKELSLDQEEVMRNEFFKSDAYRDGHVHKFEDWLEAQGYRRNGTGIFGRIKRALSLSNILRKTRKLDRFIAGKVYGKLGKTAAMAPIALGRTGLGLAERGAIGLQNVGAWAAGKVGADSIANGIKANKIERGDAERVIMRNAAELSRTVGLEKAADYIDDHTLATGYHQGAVAKVAKAGFNVAKTGFKYTVGKPVSAVATAAFDTVTAIPGLRWMDKHKRVPINRRGAIYGAFATGGEGVKELDITQEHAAKQAYERDMAHREYLEREKESGAEYAEGVSKQNLDETYEDWLAARGYKPNEATDAEKAKYMLTPANIARASRERERAEAGKIFSRRDTPETLVGKGIKALPRAALRTSIGLLRMGGRTIYRAGAYSGKLAGEAAIDTAARVPGMGWISKHTRKPIDRRGAVYGGAKVAEDVYSDKPGYAKGGPTENVPVHQEAGVVHGQEYVLPHDQYKKLIKSTAKGDAQGVLGVIGSIVGRSISESNLFTSISESVKSGFKDLSNKLHPEQAADNKPAKKSKQDTSDVLLKELLQLFKNRFSKEDKEKADEKKKSVKEAMRARFLSMFSKPDKNDKEKGGIVKKLLKKGKSLLTPTNILLGIAAAMSAAGTTMDDLKGYMETVTSVLRGIKDGAVNSWGTMKSIYKTLNHTYTYMRQIPARIGNAIHKVLGGHLGISEVDPKDIAKLDVELDRTTRDVAYDPNDPSTWTDKDISIMEGADKEIAESRKRAMKSDAPIVADFGAKTTAGVRSKLKTREIMRKAGAAIPKFGFDKKSQELLYGKNPVNPNLAKLCELALSKSPVRFSIISGKRTAAEQAAKYSAGLSDKDGYTNLSDHQRGMAVDIYPHIRVAGKPYNLWNPDKDEFAKDIWFEVYRSFQEAAKQLKMSLEFGYEYHLKNGGRDYDHISLKSVAGDKTGGGSETESELQRRSRIDGYGDTAQLVTEGIIGAGAARVGYKVFKTPAVLAAKGVKAAHGLFKPSVDTHEPVKAPSKPGILTRAYDKVAAGAKAGMRYVGRGLAYLKNKLHNAIKELSPELRKLFDKIKSMPSKLKPLIAKKLAGKAAVLASSRLGAYLVPVAGQLALIATLGMFGKYLYELRNSPTQVESAASLALIGVDLFEEDTDSVDSYGAKIPDIQQQRSNVSVKDNKVNVPRDNKHPVIVPHKAQNQHIVVKPNVVVKPVIKVAHGKDLDDSKHLQDVSKHASKSVDIQTNMLHVLGDISSKLDRNIEVTSQLQSNSSNITEPMPKSVVGIKRNTRFGN